MVAPSGTVRATDPITPEATSHSQRLLGTPRGHPQSWWSFSSDPMELTGSSLVLQSSLAWAAPTVVTSMGLVPGIQLMRAQSYGGCWLGAVPLDAPGSGLLLSKVPGSTPWILYYHCLQFVLKFILQNKHPTGVCKTPEVDSFPLSPCKNYGFRLKGINYFFFQKAGYILDRNDFNMLRSIFKSILRRQTRKIQNLELGTDNSSQGFTSLSELN